MENVGKTHVGTFLVCVEGAEVSSGGCWRHQGTRNQPAFKDGGGTTTALALGCPAPTYPSRLPHEELRLARGCGLLRPERRSTALGHGARRAPSGVWSGAKVTERLRGGCVRTSLSLSGPRHCGLASVPRSGATARFPPSPRFLKPIFSPYIFSGFIRQIGFCCFYPKNPDCQRPREA